MFHIRHNVIIKYEPARIYNAVTSKTGIQGWWTNDTKIEPLPDSIAEFVFGDKYHNKMRIRDLITDEQVMWECMEGDPEWIGDPFRPENYNSD